MNLAGAPWVNVLGQLHKDFPLAFRFADAPAGNLYFINPKFLKFVYYKGGWMHMYPEVDPANQLSNVHKVATFGNLGSGNARRLGVVTAIT